MNDLVAAALLGLVQGLTEFLPVSSTGHLILVAYAFGLDPERFGLTFDVALHLGTALAVLLYFARTWLRLLGDVLHGRVRETALIAVGVIPAAIAGVLLESYVDRELRSPLVVAAGLVAGSAVIWLAERAARSRDDARPASALSFGAALAIGAAQAIALIPGISRSGITISAGLAARLDRSDATRFSFLLATPVIVGAGAKTLLDARRAAGLTGNLDAAAVGFVVAFVAGLATVWFLVRFVRSNPLTLFIPYRLLVAAAAVGLVLLH